MKRASQSKFTIILNYNTSYMRLKTTLFVLLLSNSLSTLADISISGKAKVSFAQSDLFTYMSPVSITGKHNGFLNIVPSLGTVADSFSGDFDDFSGDYTSFSFVNKPLSLGGFSMSQSLSSEAESTSVLLQNFNGVSSEFYDSSYSSNLSNTSWSTSSENTTFEYMGQATFATFDTFVNSSSAVSKLGMSDILTKNHSVNTYRLGWEDSSGNRLTTKKTNNTTVGGTTTSLAFVHDSGELYDRVSDGGAILVHQPTSSVVEYINPSYVSSITDINSSGSIMLLDDTSLNASYIYSHLDTYKAYTLPESGAMKLSALSKDGGSVVGISYQGGYGLSIDLSNGFEPGGSGIMSFKIDSDGTYQELGNYNKTSSCSWNTSITCEKYSLATMANDISGDASMIAGTLLMVDKGALSIGDLSNALGFEAFIWNETSGFEALGSLLDSKMFSIANAINSDGSIVVGVSESNNGVEAFKWTASEGMTALGDLSGGKYFSNALDVSNDGSKIVGFSNVDTNIYEAFRWTSLNGVEGLGRPSVLESSIAMDISGDGNVIVGTMGNLDSKSLNAFRWDANNGMQKVTSWLTDTGVSVPSSLSLDIATSTDEDGNVIGGISDGNAWLSFSGRGVIFPDTYTPTLITPKVSNQASFQLLDLAIEGSHHLPLKTMSKSKDKCFWVNGDWSDKETKNTYTKLFEIGSCLDINSDTRVGLGLGKSESTKSIINEISSEINGEYLYSEIGSTPLDNKNIVLSLSAFLGSWDSDIIRYYLNSLAYDSSTGAPDISMMGVKARADYIDLFNIYGFSISPSMALTRSNIKTDAYLETGGGFPAQFDEQTQFRTVARIGIKGEKDIKDFGRLRIMVDRLHEVSRSNSNITGSIPGWIAFNIDNNSSDNDSTNIALELDKRIDENSLISTMISFKSDDEKWNGLATISYKYGF